MDSSLMILLLLLIVSAVVIAVVILRSKKEDPKGSPSPPPPSPPPPLKRGNYGFVASGFNDDNLLNNIRTMMTVYHVTDVQFFDWFPNYSGIYQNFPEKSIGGGKLTKQLLRRPNWWTSDALYPEPLFLNRQINPVLLKKAIALVKELGGVAYAYVSSQISEFGNLVNTGSIKDCCSYTAQQQTLPYSQCIPACAAECKGTTPGMIAPKPSPFSDLPAECMTRDPGGSPELAYTPPSGSNAVFQQLKENDSNVVYCQMGGFEYNGDSYERILPAYTTNAATAYYQCSAWIEPVKSMGFDGIHWDITGVTCSNDTKKDALDFVMASSPILKQNGLLQTFNDCVLCYGISTNADLFKGPDPVLQFSYSEMWNNNFLQEYVPKAAQFSEGATIAWYQNDRIGCKSLMPTLSTDQCVTNIYCTALKNNVRLLAVGCGHKLNGDDSQSVLGLINDNYFPNVIPLDDFKMFTNAIQNNYYGCANCPGC
jgi:hypothetical protein